MSQPHYITWNHNRIKTIIDNFGVSFFAGKTILDLGAYECDISGAFSRLGANVTAAEIRDEHIHIARKKYPHLSIVKTNLQKEFIFLNNKYDMVLSLGILCHLENYKDHIQNICKITDNLILESEVCDSSDYTRTIYTAEHKSIIDGSFTGIGAKPSAANIEEILLQCGMSFKRLDIPSLNSPPFKYDWKVTDTGERQPSNRRFWICSKNKKENNIEVKKHSEVIQLNDGTINSTIVKSNMFKTCLLISGHLRNFSDLYNNLYHYLIRQLDCDVFISTWDTLNANHRVNSEKLHRASTYDQINIIQKLYNPKKIIIEPTKHFYFSPLAISRNTENRDLNGMLSMFYKIKSCNDLKQEHENTYKFKYDCVIRFRADLEFHNSVNINKNMDFNKLYFGDVPFYGGYSDQFAFGSSEIMDKYSSLFDNIDICLRNDKSVYINPEKLLKYHIDKQSIPIEKTNIKFNIKR